MLDCCNDNSSMTDIELLLAGSEKSKPVDVNGEDPASCSAHSKCAGLEGACCPDKDGKMLDCCEAECSKHKKCANLEGFCCPNTDNVMLDCCNDNSSMADIELLLAGSEKSKPVDVNGEDPASCSAHSKCAGLEGAC